MNRSRERMMVVRALSWNRGWKGATKVKMRSRSVGLGENAMKNWESVGDDGVTMIAGRGDFSLARGKERFKGAGIKG